MMPKPPLTVLDTEFAIYRFSPDTPIPSSVLQSPFYWVGKTDEELSLVCEAKIELDGGVKNGGWAGFKVAGPLDFSLSGVLAGVAAALATAEISIFALSTFDTDYILVKAARLEQAIMALEKAGYDVREG